MNYNILVVDDEESILSSINRTLVRKHYSVYTAKSGKDALALMDNMEFAVIISDHHMPRMTGIELLQTVNLLSPNTERILMTGFAELDMLIDAINMGNITQIICKPWTDENLLRSVTAAANNYNIKEENKQLNDRIREQNTVLSSMNQTLEESVSERNSVLYELDQVNKSLKQTHEYQEHFIGTLSYELKGTTSLLLELSDMVLSNDIELNSVLPLFGKICNHQQNNTDDIMNYSTAERIDSNNKAEEIDIIESINFIVEMAKIKAFKHNITIELKANIDGETIFLEKTKFCQILINIVSNAVSRSPEGGTVHLNVISEQHDQTQQLHILIQDEGLGIAENHLTPTDTHINEVMTTVESRIQENGECLSFVQNMTESQGGTLCVNTDSIEVIFPYS